MRLACARDHCQYDPKGKRVHRLAQMSIGAASVFVTSRLCSSVTYYGLGLGLSETRPSAAQLQQLPMYYSCKLGAPYPPPGSPAVGLIKQQTCVAMQAYDGDRVTLQGRREKMHAFGAEKRAMKKWFRRAGVAWM
eukprot:TRINITY_DN28347_c0_g1_i3.p3 TRINITY_DN28347_c0_g1~~TRINITY_DN28347_c0_g1_i3.p3  ORF type:complete len:135 (+),score=30.95 TRINITY_DN28347_c0_g1_i3:723-1127(+)